MVTAMEIEGGGDSGRVNAAEAERRRGADNVARLRRVAEYIKADLADVVELDPVDPNEGRSLASRLRDKNGKIRSIRR